MLHIPGNLFPPALTGAARYHFGSPLTTVLLPLFTIPPAGAAPKATPPELALLSQEEWAACQGFGLAKRRDEHGSGRICAYLATAAYLAQNDGSAGVDNLEIVAGADRRPRLQGLPGPNYTLPEISIAHSHGYAAALAAEHPCGIDLQLQAAPLLRVRTRYVLAEEERHLEKPLGGKNQLARLALLWAVKEAAQKALSHWRMPGFLDLQVSGAATAGMDCLSISVTNSRAGTDRSPALLTVLASFFAEYALALCITTKEHSRAGTARS